MGRFVALPPITNFFDNWNPKWSTIIKYEASAYSCPRERKDRGSPPVFETFPPFIPRATDPLKVDTRVDKVPNTEIGHIKILVEYYQRFCHE